MVLTGPPLPRRFIVFIVAGFIFLISFVAFSRNGTPRPQKFSTGAQYAGEGAVGKGNSPGGGGGESWELGLGDVKPAKNGEFGRIYTSEEEWKQQKEVLRKGEFRDGGSGQHSEEAIKADEKRLKLDTPQMHLPTFDVPDVPLATAPKPHQIAILTASDGGGHNGGIPNIIAQAMMNRNAYARLHGYHHQFINISSYDVSGAHAVWKKIPAIIDCFRHNPEVQWIWWLDLDAIIMNSDIDLAEYLLSPEAMDRVLEKDTDYIRGLRKLGLKTPKKYDLANIDLLVSNDLNGLNAGSFFIRRSAFTQILLRLWVDPLYMLQPWDRLEQDVLAHLINSHDWIRSHVGWVKQKWINAYAFDGDDGWQWTKDCVVVHFAGCWVNGMEACKSKWKEFMGKADQKLRVDELGNPAVRGLQGVGNEHLDY